MVNMLGMLITYTLAVLEECKEGSHVQDHENPTQKTKIQTNLKKHKETKTKGAKGT